jgi:hypothetical protein
MEQRGDGAGLPGFVISEFERYLACGVLAHGFARALPDGRLPYRLSARLRRVRGADPRALRTAAQARGAGATTPLSPGPLPWRVRSGLGMAE